MVDGHGQHVRLRARVLCGRFVLRRFEATDVAVPQEPIVTRRQRQLFPAGATHVATVLGPGHSVWSGGRRGLSRSPSVETTSSVVIHHAHLDRKQPALRRSLLSANGDDAVPIIRGRAVVLGDEHSEEILSAIVSWNSMKTLEGTIPIAGQKGVNGLLKIG